MKASIYASIFAAATFVAAQNINIQDVPTCAMPCVLSSSPENCDGVDYACWCRDNTWLSTLADCVRPACPSETDQARLVSMAQGLCGAYSVTISSDILATATPAPSGSNSSNATVSATATPTESASASETSTGAADRIMVGSGLMAAAAGVVMFVL